MSQTPKRAGLSAPPGSCYPSEVVADNVRAYRSLRGLSQDQLAERMTSLGHGWHRATLSEVERWGRTVDVDELVSLALILEVTVGDLLDPAGPAGLRRYGLYVGSSSTGGRRTVPQPEARAIAHSISPVQLIEQGDLLNEKPAVTVTVTHRKAFRRWLESRGIEAE